MKQQTPNNGKLMRLTGGGTLSPKGFSLLEWLAAKPLLTELQLMTVGSYTGLARPLRFLATLCQQGLVAYIVDTGDFDEASNRHYHVTHRGIRKLAQHRKETRDDIVRRYWLSSRRLAFLVRSLAHTSACHQFFVDLIKDAEISKVMAEDRTLTLWQGEGEARRWYRLAGQPWLLKPDAFGSYKSGGKIFPFFLEWNQTDVSLSRLRLKLIPYQRYRAWWEEQENGLFPAILMVLPRQSRAVCMNELVLELAVATHTASLPVYVTTHDALRLAKPAEARWWNVAHQYISNPFRPSKSWVRNGGPESASPYLSAVFQ